MQVNQSTISNPHLWEDEDNTAAVINRTYTMTDTSDPLDLSEPEVEEEKQKEEDGVNHDDISKEKEQVVDETPDIEQNNQQTDQQEGTDEQQKEEVEKSQEDIEHEKFLSSLNSTLERETGVPLSGIVDALVELLMWRKDILAIEEQQQQKPVTPPPAFQRSSGRAGGSPNPADRSYDFRYSEIIKMTPEEYDRNAQKITDAFINQRVLMDK